MRARLAAVALVAAAALTAAACGSGQDVAAASRLALTRIGTFTQPVYVTGAPGDKRRVFVVERGGRVLVVRGGKRLSRPFLDIRDLVTSTGTEQGLLSVAFAPDYASSKRFYVYYTDRSGQQRVVEYRRSS